MNRDDVENHVDEIVTINNKGDITFEDEIRNLVYNKTLLRLVKLTKAGLAYVETPDKKCYSIPPRNVDLWNENPTSQNICLFDLDGTLVDLDKQIREDMDKLKSPTDIDFNPWGDDEWIRSRRQLIVKQDKWWDNLPQFKLGFDILHIIRSFKFEIHVLTKGPSKISNAWTGKVNWCRNNLPEDVKVTITEDKGLVYGKILVDDYPDYIIDWLEYRPRGLVIMPAHRYNRSFNHPNVIRYDGTNIEEIQRKVAYTVIRKSGEDLKEI